MLFRKKRKRGQRSFQLKSGGSIEVTYDFDMFDLSNSDRDFANGLIDYLRAYKPNGGAKETRKETKPVKADAE